MTAIPIDDDVIFVKYVPPACDEEIVITRYVPAIDRINWDDRCPSPLTPVWIDQWEDLDMDSSPDYNPNNK
jgi:hypothetical protein